MGEWSAVLFTAVGLAIGWLFNQISAWWTSRGQRLRIYRRMLFFLLQLEWLFEGASSTDVTDHALGRLREMFPTDPMPKEVEEAFIEALHMQVTSSRLTRIKEELGNLEAEYRATITELSHIDPFIAFQLEGHTSILKNLEFGRSAVGGMVHPSEGLLPKMLRKLEIDPASIAMEITAQHSTMAPQLDALSDALDSLRPKVLDADLVIIQDAMLAIGRQIGPYSWWRVRRGLRRDHVIDDAEREQLNEFLDGYLSSVKEHMRQESSL